jgi:hypothetical protein
MLGLDCLQPFEKAADVEDGASRAASSRWRAADHDVADMHAAVAERGAAHPI